MKVTQSCPTLATPWTVARQVPLSMGFSRQEYWSGLPFPSPCLIVVVVKRGTHATFSTASPKSLRWMSLAAVSYASLIVKEFLSLPLWLATKMMLSVQTHLIKWFHSVQFSCSVMSDSLLPHRLQHARLPVHGETPWTEELGAIVHGVTKCWTRLSD